ncbi:MAG TPA: cytochrome c oxidase assembly factor Coa1 family protein [Chthoniobacterales bacterium]|nr:cytochrome c oxidase assembly factor Coa1 family protein [Chthoniobacterales bacterium]
MDHPLTQPAKTKPNWWQRNWKWFVPLGCFTVAMLFLVFVGSILVIVFSAMKSTDVYKEALARAKADPAVIEALGSPIQDGFFISGNTNVNGASGESNLAIPISGPKGKGTIYASATKSLGQWNYSGLVVEVGQTHERLDLLHKPAPSQSP